MYNKKELETFKYKTLIPLLESFSFLNGKNILDFGCGSMELSKRMQKKIFIKKIIGTDTFEYNFKK